MIRFRSRTQARLFLCEREFISTENSITRRVTVTEALTQETAILPDFGAMMRENGVSSGEVFCLKA
jgi:hypothetical protein